MRCLWSNSTDDSACSLAASVPWAVRARVFTFAYLRLSFSRASSGIVIRGTIGAGSNFGVGRSREPKYPATGKRPFCGPLRRGSVGVISSERHSLYLLLRSPFWSALRVRYIASHCGTGKDARQGCACVPEDRNVPRNSPSILPFFIALIVS